MVTDEMTDREKADRMRRWTGLAQVRKLLNGLGDWPRTDAEWALAYDLLMEERRRR